MTTLTEADYLALSQCLHDLYAHADLDEFRRRLMAAVKKLVPCDIIAYNEVNQSEGRLAGLMEPGDLDVARVAAALVPYLGEHPLVRKQQDDDGRAYKISDFLTRHQFHSTGMYTDFYKSLGVEHQMAVALVNPTRDLVALVLNRSIHDFDERERLLLDLLRPHLLQAYQNAQTVSRLRANREAHFSPEPLLALGLTARESEVMLWVTQGKTNPQIAAILGLSARTVQKHLEHIFQKLGVETRTTAATRALEAMMAQERD